MKSFSISYFNKLNNISSLGVIFKSSSIFSSINSPSFTIKFLFLSPFLGEIAALFDIDFLPLEMLGLLDFLGDLTIFILGLIALFFSSFIKSIKGFIISTIFLNSSNFLFFSSFICSI